jgi:hypothetical protein
MVTAAGSGLVAVVDTADRADGTMLTTWFRERRRWLTRPEATRQQVQTRTGSSLDFPGITTVKQI